MTKRPDHPPNVDALAYRCLHGDEAAWQELSNQYRPLLIGVLRQRGAAEVEAEEVVDELFAACFAGRNGGEPLLLRYRSQCA